MLIDAHTHLDHYREGLESVLKEINRHRVFSISNSMGLESYERNLEIAELCNLVLPIFGVHPWNAPEYVSRLENLKMALTQSPMIGEIGLDYHWVKDASQYPAQREVFEFLLAAASEQGKSINVHTKGAEKEVMQLLRRYNIQRAIIHWYSGPLDVLQTMIDYGLYFTVGVEVTTSQEIQVIAQRIPTKQLLTETDNPGGQSWLTGETGMPRHMINVVQKLAELRKTSTEDIIETVQSNFSRLINDDPWLSDSCRNIPELAGN